MAPSSSSFVAAPSLPSLSVIPDSFNRESSVFVFDICSRAIPVQRQEHASARFLLLFCSCMNAKICSTPNQPKGQRWLPHTDDRLWHDLDGIMAVMDDTARNPVTQSGRRRNEKILMI